jgi:hypothetical protein
VDYDITATERTAFHWLATDTVWDLDPVLYDTIARTAIQMRWASVTSRPTAAAAHRSPALDYLDTGFITATGAAEQTVWASRAKRHRTKPVPHTLTGVREITVEGTRSLLLLTGSDTSVPVAVWEQTLLGPAVDSPCAAEAHRYCDGRDQDGRACGCRCGCRWPDRLTDYQHLTVGDAATDPAWSWAFTVTGAAEPQDTGNLALEVRGADEQSAELLYRPPSEPVIVHNAWRLHRDDPPDVSAAA